MRRHFNIHFDEFDLKSRHNMIEESRGKLMLLKTCEYHCRKGEPTNVCSYVENIYQSKNNRICNSISLQKYAYSFISLLVYIFFVSIFSACSNADVENQLSKAESFIIEHPDSTVSLLVNMDTTHMSESQIARQELLYLYTQLIYGNQLPIDSADIATGNKFFANKFNNDEIKWLIVKSAEANRSGDPVARIELLKDAEFLAIQSNDKVDLGIIYLFLSKVYEQGFNGTVSNFMLISL